MKLTVIIDRYRIHNGALYDEVKAIVEPMFYAEDFFEVELFGVDLYADHLPDNYSIVHYGSRETLVVCEDGEIIADKDEIQKWENENC